MISITSSWRDYFENHHEGMGTTYERFILHQYFEKIKNSYSIQSALESPSFGMTGVSGINSIWWASRGVDVTITDNEKERINLIKGVWQELSFNVKTVFQPLDSTSLPFDDKSFDMGWNFAALWFIPNLEEFLKELARVINKVIFICIPNRSNIFYFLRRLFNSESEGLYIENINRRKIKKIMLKQNWQIVDQGYLDIPPWPDIAMNKEDLIKKIGLTRLANRLKNNTDNYISILDYFNGKSLDMEKEILGYDFLENSPRFIQKVWAHHQFLIFAPGSE